MYNRNKSKSRNKSTDDNDQTLTIKSTIDKIILNNPHFNNDGIKTDGFKPVKNPKRGIKVPAETVCKPNKERFVKIDKAAYQEKVNQTMNKIITGLGETASKFAKIEDDMKDVLKLTNELCETRKLQHKINTELNNLNNSSKYESRASLISNLEKESRLIKKLETENKELETAIKFQDQVLSLTMKKYRQQRVDLQKIKDLEMDDKKIDNSLLEDRYKYFQTVHDQLVPVMESGCIFEEAEIEKNEKIISLLKKGIADLQKKLLK